MTWGVPLSVSYHFAFSYCSWGSQDKSTEVVCYSLLQWTILSDLSTMTHPSWVARRAWLGFIELDKAVVLVWLDWLIFWVWFQCVCPLMPSCNTYHLTWVSLTLGVGYLFSAAPAKRSLCCLSWTKDISSPWGDQNWKRHMYPNVHCSTIYNS